MEQSTLRSRSFRKVLFASCSLSLFLVTLHTLSGHQQFQQKVVEGYQFISRKEAYAWISRPRHVDNFQTAFHDGKVQSDDISPSFAEHMNGLPEVVRIPFEEAVKDVSLNGWEDDWISSADFDSTKYGSLDEPKLDFVYNCECFIL